MSVLRTGRGRAGGVGGGGPGCHFLTEKMFFFPTKFFFQKCSWGSETHANKNLFFGGGGILGFWGAPRPHPGVARGRKTIHFFL